jgi:glyoxylase-like metal-dependent hydrolase (beta-lactamase superfamily II)
MVEMKIHPIQTGSVVIKKNQQVGKGVGAMRLLNMLFGSEWTASLPILAWVIDHPEGIIIVDTGETSRSTQPDYFPRWHPYYRLAVRMTVAPEDEIGPQLHKLGVQPADVKTVILTHLHTDHAGGLHHFPKSDIYVHSAELVAARSLEGRIMNGYLPHRWPTWFSPKLLAFEAEQVGSFDQVQYLTRARDVMIVPTPGHTPNHVSVIVRQDGVSYFLAGDTTYTEQILIDRQVDGVSPNKSRALSTINRIINYTTLERTVYLPTHDPNSMQRLAKIQAIRAE